MAPVHRLATTDDAAALFDLRRRSILELAAPGLPAGEAEAWVEKHTLARMERKLRSEFGSVDVINSAVMGYSPYNELQYYLTRGKTFEADIVVVAFCMNDIVNPRLHWGDAPGVKIPDEAIPNLEYDRSHILPKIQQLREEQARSAHGRGFLKDSELYQALEKALKRLSQNKPKHYPVNSSGVPTLVTAEDSLSIEVLLDRARYGMYPPGSSFKVVTAIAALRDNACFRTAFGDPFIDYFIKLKEFEIGRFLSDVTDWEQREYFAIL